MNKKPKDWNLIKETLHANCRVFNVIKKHFRHPDGREGDFFVNKSSDWVQVIALTTDNKALMVSQFRFGTRTLSLEFPGGIIDDNEKPSRTAERELLEETGYAGEKTVLLHTFSPNPAIQENQAYIYLIKNCKKIADVKFDNNEEIQTKLVDIDSLDKLVKSKKIHHSIAINAVYFLQQYLKNKA